MTSKEIIKQRLQNQHISATSFTKPEEIISYFGAMQSQDWSMAKWALGLRLPHLRDKDVEDKFNAGKILRTHILRPTWHFISPKDLRWMQALTSTRVRQANASQIRKLNVNSTLILKTEKIIGNELQDKNYLTRDELNLVFEKNKIKTDPLQLVYILMHAELEALICSGPRKGKQFTYALVEERVPATKALSKEAALKKLTNIYFNSRSPATVHDYSWWSGLTLKDAREGIELLGPGYEKEIIEGKEYIFKPAPVPDLKGKQTTFLIPDFDEYGISYKDRSLYHHPKWKETESMTNADYFHAIAVDGYFGGTWNKKTVNNKVMATVHLFRLLTVTQKKKVERAMRMYDRFFKSA